jgi:glycosyltransferase involved in cell wall biosynthesis
MAAALPSGEKIPLIQLIARLNVGGPAIHVIDITQRLPAYGYRTILLRGREEPHEESMDYLAAARGVSAPYLAGFRREPGFHDLQALWQVIRWIRRERPTILHTHTAKAGALGRIAASLLVRQRPQVVVHTFHGHGFVGEFSPATSRIYAWVERQLAHRATRLVAVSEEVRQDLIHLGVAPPEQIEVVRLGFDLSPFMVPEDVRQRTRREMRSRLGIPQDAKVVTIIARVVKVKRVDRFLAMARCLADRKDVWFVIAGDGDDRARLERSGDARALSDRLVWAGYERGIPAVCFASDVVTLTSDSEGTPVALIEAQAAGLPVVSTRVGGVETVVLDGESGQIVDADPVMLSSAVRDLLDDPATRASFGERGRQHCLANFSVERLVEDLDGLYRRLLAETNRKPAR